MQKKHLIIILTSIITAFLILCTTLLCLYKGWILLNNPSLEHYPIRGVDVSSYQGKIDWQVLAGQGIDFAFIKATEGSSSVDPCFEYNFAEAQKTHLRVGAYHFFSFESAGATQAENFINTVPKTDGMLPPVIDLEFYGDTTRSPMSPEIVHKELDDMINALTAHYGTAPIIYVTKESYSLYIEGGYEDLDIWYRNVFTSAGTPDGREWTFWQYTNRERLEGYDGPEKFIDMNVFYGSKEQFEKYGISE